VNHQRLFLERTGGSHRCEQSPELSATDALFAMLDGQVIRGRKGVWRAEVVSILEEADATWVQIGPARKPAKSVVLRMDRSPRADRALEALRAWTDLPEERRPARVVVSR
jgi:hypothetical protein